MHYAQTGKIQGHARSTRPRGSCWRSRPGRPTESPTNLRCRGKGRKLGVPTQSVPLRRVHVSKPKIPLSCHSFIDRSSLRYRPVHVSCHYQSSCQSNCEVGFRILNLSSLSVSSPNLMFYPLLHQYFISYISVLHHFFITSASVLYLFLITSLSVFIKSS